MAAMRTVGNGHAAPPNGHVRAEEKRYVIDLAVPDFTESELSVELLGRTLTVRGEQVPTVEDEGQAFRLRERLAESFRLPDDAQLDQIRVVHHSGALEIHVPRVPLEARRLPIASRSPYAINPGAKPC